MTATCLFTGEELGPDTQLEHTIPERMGGRIKSSEVSSSEFNNLCGSFCDDKLGSAYHFLLTQLAPLLPSASQPSDLGATSGDGLRGIVIKPGARLGMRGNSVVERFPDTGRPKTVIGPDEESLRRFAKNAKMSNGTEYQSLQFPDSNVETDLLPVISPEIELAALKSILLSFDHLLSRHPDRITRSDQLADVRQFVWESIKQSEIRNDRLGRFSLGIQIEKLSFYECLREEMQFDRSPFEHFMLIAGNLPQRCIDAVWMVFGFEPFGFRLRKNYRGPDFCYGFVNPIFKGKSASGLIELRLQDELLCRPTERRSYQEENNTEVVQVAWARIANEIGERRSFAFDQAKYTVHTRPECDDWLIERLREDAENGQSARMIDVIADRLRDLYSHHEPASAVNAAVESAVSRSLQEQPKIPNTQSLAEVDSQDLWPAWLNVFRTGLDFLVPDYGLPGGGYHCDANIKLPQET